MMGIIIIFIHKEKKKDNLQQNFCDSRMIVGSFCGVGDGGTGVWGRGGGGSHGCLIPNEIRSSDQMASITKQTLNATKNLFTGNTDC